MICAGYCAYGSATELIITYGKGIQRFTLDPSLGEFILTADKMTLPVEEKKIYSINEGNYTTWDQHMQKAVDSFKFRKSPYTARYVGSMVRYKCLILKDVSIHSFAYVFLSRSQMFIEL